MGTDRFKSKTVSGEQAARIEDIQKAFCTFFDVIDASIPEGREKSLMITKLEEACMWGTKAISIEPKEIVNEIRTCSECGNSITEGYCIDNGAAYYCCDKCLHTNISVEDYVDMYDDGKAYYTSWTE